METIISDSAEQTVEFGKILADALQIGDIVVLCGDLGAGKTHLSKGIALGLGISSEITSPTFNICRQYMLRHATTLCHWDLYRLDESAQLEDVGFYELIEDECISLIEWGDKFEDALPAEYLKISISLLDESRRELCICGCEARGKELEKNYIDLLKAYL